MNYYRAIVAYDGGAYAGWQIQTDQRSIQQVLSDTFERIFTHAVTLHGASRTDAGVHALGQVVLCQTVLSIDPETLRFAWNNKLPKDVFIRSVDLVSADFHPRQNVRQKIYHYYLFDQPPLPFVQRYGWYYRYPINRDKLQEALQVFVGSHDFRSFCTGDNYQAGTVRTIDQIEVSWVPEKDMLQITFVGERFMRHMIRRLVGAAVTIAARSALTNDDLLKVLAAKNPAHALPTAPASGLLLYKIIYRS